MTSTALRTIPSALFLPSVLSCCTKSIPILFSNRVCSRTLFFKFEISSSYSDILSASDNFSVSWETRLRMAEISLFILSRLFSYCFVTSARVFCSLFIILRAFRGNISSASLGFKISFATSRPTPSANTPRFVSISCFSWTSSWIFIS